MSDRTPAEDTLNAAVRALQNTTRIRNTGIEDFAIVEYNDPELGNVLRNYYVGRYDNDNIKLTHRLRQNGNPLQPYLDTMQRRNR